MVFDAAAEKERDVDVTARVARDDGTESVFEGLEVKDHTRPLDVTHVEQLCIKLRDMPAITERGIVSASGYTETAINKARRYGVTLYSLLEWSVPVEIATVTLIPNFEYLESGYQWVEGPHVHFSPRLEVPEALLQQLTPETPVFDKGAALLAEPSTYKGLGDRLAAGAINLAKVQGHPLDMAVGEKRPVLFNIRTCPRRLSSGSVRFSSMTPARAA